MVKEIEVFRTGEHTDINGNKFSATSEKLDNIVEVYNRTVKADSSRIAPLVKGHPKTDSPAFGWVDYLRRIGDKIIAGVNLVPQFAEEVKDGLFKKVSISLYDNDMLRHVGFLGAAQPAVKGLKNVEFSSEEDYASIEVEFSEEVPGSGDNPEDVEDNADDSNENDDKEPREPEEDDAKKDESDENSKLDKNIDEKNSAETARINAAVQKRAEQHNIEVVESKVRAKPGEYKNLKDDDFADPVHWRFPVKLPYQIRSSLAIFRKPSVRNQYTDKSKTTILSRLLNAAVKNNISLTPEVWAFREELGRIAKEYQFADVPIPVDQLSKQQMVDFINKVISIDNNRLTPSNQFKIHNPKGLPMEKWLQDFVAFVTGKLAESVNEETATQFQAWVEEFLTQNPLPSGNSEEQDDSSGTAGSADVPAQFSERLEELERENRMYKYEKFFSEKLDEGKVLPSQKDIVLSNMEAAFKNENIYQFAEKQKTARDLLEELIDSYPKLIELKEFAEEGDAATPPVVKIDLPSGKTATADKLELHGKIVQFQEDMREKGKELTFTQARNAYLKQQR